MWWNPWQASIAMEITGATRASADALARLRAQRLAALLDAAGKKSPMYREIIGGRDPAGLALSDLPVVNKRALMERFDDWVADPRLRLPEIQRFIADPRAIGAPYLHDYIVWESSGSSGEPGVFVQDAQAMSVYDALEALRRPILQPFRRWCDPFYATERIAFVGATGGHFATTASVQRLCRVNPLMSTRMRSVSFLQPAASLVAQLDALAPTVLATYPTAALMLAEEAAAGRLRLHLQEIWTGGEALTPAMRNFISEAFGCPVAQSYGSSEFLSMASECRFGSLHLNTDWLILESVDEMQRPVPDGQMGHTCLLTNLANRVQPVIRYQLGDRITLHSKNRCACGSSLPVIEVQGRVDDSLLMRGAAGHDVRLLPLALTTVLEEEARVFDFQLVQDSPRALTLRVAAAGDEGQRQADRGCGALKRYLREQGLARVTLAARCGEPGVPGRSGKVARVVAQATPA